MSKETDARRALIAVLIIGAIVVGWLVWQLPRAEAAECATVSFEWTGGQVSRVGDEAATEGIRTELVGTFLWVNYGFDEPDPDTDYAGTVSVELPAGAVSAVVCPDGTVTFESAPAPQISTALTMVDLEALWGFDPTLDLRFGPR